ncbi:hypothetical protein [Marinoscillum sp. 108]|uniref:hypothetical protein n=1 Tax=Marinoscillum sp. 108 TaxID=2653151 RepID=UPI0012EFBCE7|nr:hypothetical protein [Marinoscillum sp. 108]VXD11558.1 hypothetical protein MARINOS108_10574 [Marinoscillum sp. 108]
MLQISYQTSTSRLQLELRYLQMEMLQKRQERRFEEIEQLETKVDRIHSELMRLRQFVEY